MIFSRIFFISISLIIIGCSNSPSKLTVNPNIEMKIDSELTIYPLSRSTFFIFPAGYGNFESYMIRQLLSYRLEMLGFKENFQDPLMKVYLELPPKKIVITLKDKFDNTMWKGSITNLGKCDHTFKRTPEMLSVLFRNYPKSLNANISLMSNAEIEIATKLKSVFARTIQDWNCN